MTAGYCNGSRSNAGSHKKTEYKPQNGQMGLKSPGFAEIVEGRINISTPRGPEMGPKAIKKAKNKAKITPKMPEKPEISSRGTRNEAN